MTVTLRPLDNNGVIAAPATSRAGDAVYFVGLDAHHAVFASAPRSLDDAAIARGEPVLSDVTTIARESGAVVARTTFAFHALDDQDRGGSFDWIAQVSVASRSALTRRGHLVSIEDASVRARLPFVGGDVAAFGRDGRSFLWGRRESARAWTFSLHDTSSGVQRSAASAIAPMMCYVAPTLERVIVVGGRSASAIRSWRTSEAKSAKLTLPVKGDVIVSPNLSRWVFWNATRTVRAGLIDASNDDGAIATFDLPASTEDAGIRYALGDRLLIVAAATMERTLTLLVYDLATTQLVDEVLVDDALQHSASVYLDPTEQWVAFTSSAGPCVWRIGSRDVYRVMSPADGRTSGFAGEGVVSGVAMGHVGPWTEVGSSPGLFVLRNGDVIVARLPRE